MKNWRLLVLVAILSAASALFVREKLTPAPSYDVDALVSEFFTVYHGRRIQRDTYWLGVPVQQTPTDMWMIQEIITEIRPDFLVETGTLHGGSSLFYASVLNAMNGEARVITVDINPQIAGAGDFPVFASHVVPVTGDSTAEETIRRISNLVQGRSAIVILDSDHRKEHVLRELRLYSRFVPVGSYIVVHDTDLNGHPVRPGYGPGPMEAVEEFLAEDDRFVADRSREKFMLTMCPMGFLKRVR